MLRSQARSRSAVNAKSTINDAVLFDNADQQDEPISAITLRSNRTPARSTTPPAPADGNVEQNRQWMNVAFHTAGQHDIDSDQRGADQNKLSASVS